MAAHLVSEFNVGTLIKQFERVGKMTAPRGLQKQHRVNNTEPI